MTESNYDSTTKVRLQVTVVANLLKYFL